MKLRVLGCSGGIGKGLRTTSYVLDDTILLDAGTGVGELTLDEMLLIRHVIITHAHLDHVCGLALMLASIYDDMPPPITIHAPPPVLAVLKISLYNWQLWPDFNELPDESDPILKFHALTEEQNFKIDDKYEIQAVILGHTVESFAYVIETHNANFCFFGDTGPTEKVWQLLNSKQTINQLLIEVSYSNDNQILAMQSGHYTANLLKTDLAQLNYKPKIYIQHIKPGSEQQVIAECMEALKDFPLHILKHDDLVEF